MTSPQLDGAPAPTGAMSAARAHRAAARELRAAGVATPELDARLLVCAAAGLRHEAFVADPDRTLAARERDRLARLLARRVAREPVSRILGRREFWGRDFLLSGAVLDPRPDSETLIDAVLRCVRGKGAWRRDPVILDLGTGSGVLLLTLLAELEGARGVGTDVSTDALRIARENAARLGVAHRARFVAASWLDGLRGPFDIVIANPPYIPSADIAGLAPEVSRYDPALALDGGIDGLQSHRHILSSVGSVLAAPAFLALEVGQGQAEAVADLIARAGLAPSADEPELWHDLAGVARCVTQWVGSQKGVGNSERSG